MNSTVSPRIYTLQFWLLCASNFLFSASFQMLIPELPDYLTSLGGASYKGYIIALFTLTAGISRPFSGKLTDTVGRVPVMVFGSLVCVVCSALYPFTLTVLGFLWLRLLHGFSTGFKPTATAAYVADLIPVERRGEAMSTLGISGALGMSVAPVIGSSVTEGYGINTLFAISSLFALLSVLILVRNMNETLTEKVRFHPRLLKIERSEIFEPRAFPTFLVQLLVAFASGVCLTLIPDLSKHLGIANKGLFFAVYTAASLFIRIVAREASDRMGRVAVLRWAAFGNMLAMLLVALSGDKVLFLLAAVVYGLSWGMTTPTLQAWTVDLVDEDNRGRGLATMFIALEAGIGLGAWVSGAWVQNDLTTIAMPFYMAAALSAVALIYLFQKPKFDLKS